MSTAATLLLALLLDAALGEPKFLWDRIPHPAVLIGRAISWIDQGFNNGESRKRAGTLSFAGLILVAGLFGFALQSLPTSLIDILIAAIFLAQKSLCQHVQAVGDALRLSLGDGRRSVAMIVGRDTREMDAPAVARGAIESGAENLSDGIIAPAFWFLIGGLPGLLIYKVTNTADSMIGYRTPRHEDFGWAAARFDDLLNFIPARLTALLIALQSPKPINRLNLVQEAALHRSPNAGWPEAAIAQALDVALSGPRSYDGEMRDFPFVHPNGQHAIGPPEIDSAVSMLWRTWSFFTALIATIALTIAII